MSHDSLGSWLMAPGDVGAHHEQNRLQGRSTHQGLELQVLTHSHVNVVTPGKQLLENLEMAKLGHRPEVSSELLDILDDCFEKHQTVSAVKKLGPPRADRSSAMISRGASVNSSQ